MKLGIVGLPNVGKSTLFNALTKGKAPSENYPFCTIDPNIGTVIVPDERLKVLQSIYKSKEITPAVVDFVDIAGLVKGASKGEGLGNKFLSHIREVDAIVHIVRCFENPDIIHVDGNVNPERDIDTINTELILSDIETLQKRIEKQEKELRAASDKKVKDRVELLNRLLKHLSDGKMANRFTDDEDEKNIIGELFLLTAKPVIYVGNFSEEDITMDLSGNHFLNKIREIAEKENAEVITVSAGIEAELAQLNEEERVEFLNDMGLKESGLDKLIRASYKLLGLISFYTAGEKESRAWTIVKGSKAPQAAGKIHTDFEKGFIRAEVVSYNDIVSLGSPVAAKEAGRVRLEGKENVVQDDDIIIFRFNV